MVEPSRKKQKGSASILHFFRTCEHESNDEASHVRKQVEDEIFIAEPQPLPQSGGFNQPLPHCCESNESPNAVNILINLSLTVLLLMQVMSVVVCQQWDRMSWEP